MFRGCPNDRDKWDELVFAFAYVFKSGASTYEIYIQDVISWLERFQNISDEAKSVGG